MSWNHSSKLGVAALAAVLVLAAVGTAGAITVTEANVPEEAEVNASVTASVQFDEPFANQTSWHLESSTDLTDASWTVEYIQNGEVEATYDYDSDGFYHGPINRTGAVSPDAIRVNVSGSAPPIEEYDFHANETFDAMDLVQVWNEGLNWSVIGEWQLRHYSQAQLDAEARLESVNQSIQTARANGTDVSDAEARFQDAVQTYESGSLEFAVQIADDAESRLQDDDSSSDGGTDDGNQTDGDNQTDGGTDGGNQTDGGGQSDGDQSSDSGATGGDGSSDGSDSSGSGSDDGGVGFLSILLGVVVLALIGGGGFYLYQQNQGPQRDPLG